MPFYTAATGTHQAHERAGGKPVPSSPFRLAADKRKHIDDHTGREELCMDATLKFPKEGRGFLFQTRRASTVAKCCQI